MKLNAKNAKIIQVVLIFAAVVLLVGATAMLFGGFDNGDAGSSGGGGGGSSNTETVAPDVSETYEPSEGDPTCSHKMDDGKVVTVATCSAEGTKVFTCTKCGYTEEEKISKSNQHTYSLKTYTENEHMKYCTVCNNSTLYEEHSFTETVREATCTTSGNYTYSCLCGHKKSETISAKGHLVASWVESGTSHVGTCTRSGCGQQVTEEHVYGSVVTVEATCSAAGSKTQTCEACGSEKVSVVPKLSHSPVSSTTAATCTKVGSTVVTCEECGVQISQTTISASGHSFVYETVESPTCTSIGTQSVTCRNCDYSDTRTLSATGHTVGSTWEEGPYCDSEGGAGYWCADCEATITTEVYEPTGHSWGALGICSRCGASCSHNMTPTYDSMGTESGATCTICGYHEGY